MVVLHVPELVRDHEPDLAEGEAPVEEGVPDDDPHRRPEALDHGVRLGRQVTHLLDVDRHVDVLLTLEGRDRLPEPRVAGLVDPARVQVRQRDAEGDREREEDRRHRQPPDSAGTAGRSP